jgi:hypothetical protein
MSRRARRLILRGGGLVAGTLTAAYLLSGRERQLRWGATDAERDECLPGDDLIPAPDLTSTRAITVNASRDDVWPWLAQVGQGRGGFYSYDRLENLVGCRIHSADSIVPEWQDPGVGDRVGLAPEVGLEVAQIVPGRSLVLRGGIPLGRVPPPYDFSWAFVAREQPDGATRLLVRERYAYTRGWAALIIEPVSVISLVMSRAMLRGIKHRAERRGASATGVTASPSGREGPR